jgi:hypothetical protein
MENHRFFHGKSLKIDYFYGPFSVAMLNYQSVDGEREIQTYSYNIDSNFIFYLILGGCGEKTIR